jgi:transcriptional regulator with XRE-family HTH domain
MVTRIHKHGKKRLFLKEHREAKGVSAEAMGGRLGIERESVYRQERAEAFYKGPLAEASETLACCLSYDDLIGEWWRVDPGKQLEWAAALGLDDPGALWRPPTAVSLDEMVRPAPDDVQKMAVDIVRRLVAGR